MLRWSGRSTKLIDSLMACGPQVTMHQSISDHFSYRDCRVGRFVTPAMLVNPDGGRAVLGDPELNCANDGRDRPIENSRIQNSHLPVVSSACGDTRLNHQGGEKLLRVLA